MTSVGVGICYGEASPQRYSGNIHYVPVNVFRPNNKDQIQSWVVWWYGVLSISFEKFPSHQGKQSTIGFQGLGYRQALKIILSTLIHMISCHSHSWSRQWVQWTKTTHTVASTSTTAWLQRLLTTPTSPLGTTKVMGGQEPTNAFL